MFTPGKMSDKSPTYNREVRSPALILSDSEEEETGINFLQSTEHIVMAGIDKHALSIPDEFLKKSIQDVVSYLIEPAKDEIQAARALFRWLTAQSLDLPVHDDSELPSNCACMELKKVKAGKLEYSELFREMASLAKIECVLVSGVRKVFPQKPCPTVYKFTTWHWASVLLQRRWRLVDCHMGARVWQETNAYDATDGNPHKHGDDPLATFLNDYYFLTNPKDLIRSHFPDDEGWQLLRKPMGKSEFKTMSYVTPFYLFYSIQARHGEKLHIHTTYGEATFEFVLPENISMQFSYRLRRVHKNENRGDEQTFEDCVFLENIWQKHLTKITVMPPENGQYVFDLFGKKSANLTVTNKSHLCSYLIICGYADTTLRRFPPNEIMEWGPGSAVENVGMIPVSHFEGTATTTDGKLEIVFFLSQPLIFRQTLIEKSPGFREQNAYVINRTENKEVLFTVNPPKPGDYCLKIFSKKDNEDCEFNNICNYLIHCCDILEEPAPYPKEACGQIGVKSECGRLGLKLVRPQSAVIYAPKIGRVSIVFEVSKPVLLSPELLFCGEKGNAELVPESLTQIRSGSDVTFHIKLPRHGLYFFRLSSRNPNEDGELFDVYSSIIHCNWPSKETLTPPTYDEAWKPTYTLHFPTEKHIPADACIPFSVTIPGAHGVVVITVSGKYWLDHKGDNLWEGFVDTKNCSETVCKVSACMKKRLMTYSVLVTFKILSQSELEKMQDVRGNNYQMAIERINRLKQRGKWRPPPISLDALCDVDDDNTLPDDDKRITSSISGNSTEVFEFLDDSSPRNSTDLSPRESHRQSSTESQIASSRESPRQSNMDTSSKTSIPKTEVQQQEKNDVNATENVSTDSSTISPSKKSKNTKQKHKTSNFRTTGVQDEVTEILPAQLSMPEQESAKSRKANTIPKIPSVKTHLSKVGPPKRMAPKLPSTHARPPLESSDRLLKCRGVYSGTVGRKAAKRIRRAKAGLLTKVKGDKILKPKGTVPLKDIMKDMESAMEGQDIGGGDKCTPRSNSSDSDSDSDSDKELLRISAYARWMKEQQKQGAHGNKTYRTQLAVLRSRLISNATSQDKLGLREAIADAEKENIAVHTLEYDTAIRTLSVLSLKDEILDNIDKKDVEGIKHTISAIERRGFRRDLCAEIAHARVSLKVFQRTSLKRLNTGVIDIPTLAEISRYREPPRVVHRVVMAVLLLMGIPEGITKQWKRCQKVGVMMGSGGMNRRVHQLMIDDIHPMIAARARQILEIFIPEDAIAVSPGVGALYKWVRRVVGEVLIDNEDPDNPVEPANERTQRQIFSTHSRHRRKIEREKTKVLQYN